MGRNKKIPLENGRIVNASQVSTEATTPYHPRDIHNAVCQRLFGQDTVPGYADEGTQR